MQVETMKGAPRKGLPILRFTIAEARAVLRVGRGVDVQELARRAGFLLREGGTASLAQLEAMSAQLDLMMAEDLRREKSSAPVEDSKPPKRGGSQRERVAARLVRVEELEKLKDHPIDG